MTTVPLSEAKNRLSELVESVDRTHDRVMITKNGRETAMLVSARDYESLEATLELLMDPAAQERLRGAQEEVASGDVVTSDELARLLERRRAEG
jgi:antitoxin YefM